MDHANQKIKNSSSGPLVIPSNNFSLKFSKFFRISMFPAFLIIFCIFLPTKSLANIPSKRTLGSGMNFSIYSHRCRLSITSRSASSMTVSCSKRINNRFISRPKRKFFLTPQRAITVNARACSLQVRVQREGNVELICVVPTSQTPPQNVTPTPTPLPPTPTPTVTPPTPTPTPTPTPQRQIGGAVSGLSGTVVLQNNGANNLSISSNGNFNFSSSVAQGSNYNVTVLTQPASQTCTITNGAGTAGASDITNVAVTCAINQYTVTASAGANGSISPSGAQTVNSGANISFTATANSGHAVNQWLVGGSPVQSGGNTFQLSNVTSNQTVSVSFGTISLAPSVSNLALSINCLPASACTATQNAALTGNPRNITIQNTGSLTVTNLSVTAPSLPSGTSISSNTCGSTLSAGSTCTITLTPGEVASSTCTSGAQATASNLSVTADGGISNTINIFVLGYGCQYQGGFIYAIDDTTAVTASIAGKVASLVDQADPFIGTGPQASSIIWSSDGTSATAVDNATILGISDLSTTSVAHPQTPAYPLGTPAFSACAGKSDGACNTANILSYYNFNRTSGGSAPTPLNFYASGLCAATINTFSNWYLPAICELDSVNVGVTCPSGTQSIVGSLSFLLGDSNATTPSTSCTPPSGSACLAGFYWSSTESSIDTSLLVWIQELRSGGSSFQIDGTDKSQRFGVRCSRAF